MLFTYSLRSFLKHLLNVDTLFPMFLFLYHGNQNTRQKQEAEFVLVQGCRFEPSSGRSGRAVWGRGCSNHPEQEVDKVDYNQGPRLAFKSSAIRDPPPEDSTASQDSNPTQEQRVKHEFVRGSSDSNHRDLPQQLPFSVSTAGSSLVF